MPTTLKDVANLAGVHSSTASRVLRGKENVNISKVTRKKIIAAAKELKYQPNQAAQSLRLKKSNTIGLIVPDISNPFFARIARTIEMNSYEIGYTVIVCNTDEDQDKEDKFLNVLLSRRIDGLILCPVQDSKEKVCELLDKKFPLVLIDRCFDDMQANAVVSDNIKSAYEAVSHLIKNGHKRIAFIRGRKNIYTVQKRLEGYTNAVRDFKIDNNPDLIAGNGFRLEDGYDATIKLLNLQKRPTALLVSGNLISVGMLKAIIDSGLNIPDDISVIAYADNVLLPYLITPLTTVSHPLQLIGSSAFNMLITQIKSKEPVSYSKTIIQAQFEIRESVKSIK